MIGPNRVIQGDCVEILKGWDEPFADLIFADPPFNIGYKYDIYEDRKRYKEYRSWTYGWMKECKRILSPTGSFWIAIGDEYAAEVCLIGRRLKLHLRNWVLWHYAFGQNAKRKFARSHTHLFYFVKDPKHFVFNDAAVRTFSDRERTYKDRRANGEGRIPDDVWTEFPRVCGTFAERKGWHPCQMPETLLARIIRVCTDPGQLVLDPFAGSGTTLVVAKKLSRKYLGMEISEKYVQGIKERLALTKPLADITGERTGTWPEEHLELLGDAYVEFGIATDKLFKNEHLLLPFARRFNLRLKHSGIEEQYEPKEVWTQLERLRKAGKLGKIRVHAEERRKPPVRNLSPQRSFDSIWDNGGR